jgi:hypothetical protein
VLPGCETGYAEEELVPYNRTDTKTPDKGHVRFLPHPFQFIVLQSLHATLSEAIATCLRHTGPKTADKIQNCCLLVLAEARLTITSFEYHNTVIVCWSIL